MECSHKPFLVLSYWCTINTFEKPPCFHNMPYSIICYCLKDCAELKLCTCLSLVMLCIIETLSDTHLLTSTFLDSILLGPVEGGGAEVLAESWVD